MVTPINVGAAMRRGRVARRDEQNRLAQQQAQQADLARRTAARDALVEEYGVTAGDPVALGQLRGIDRQDRVLDMREQEFAAAQEEARRQQLGETTQRLGALVGQRIQSGADPLAAFDSVVPILERGFGADPESIAALRETVAANPEAAPQILAAIGGVQETEDFTPRGSPGEFIIGGRRVFGQPGIDSQGNFTVRPAEGVRQARDPRAAPQRRARGGPIKVIGQDGREQTVVPMNDGTFVPAPFSLPDEEDDSQEARKQRAGQARLNSLLGDLTQTYLSLNERGAIPRAGRPIGENLGARAQASGLGIMVGQALGREQASALQGIINIRPLLLAAIKDAAGLSGRAMDSNRELEFYLQAATSPGDDFFANLAAIDALDKSFGLGGVLQEQLPPEIYQRVSEVSGRMLSERPIPPLRAADGTTGNTVESALDVDPEVVERNRRDGDAQLQPRAAALGVEMEDVLYTAEQEDLSPAEVLDLLEERNAR